MSRYLPYLGIVAAVAVVIAYAANSGVTEVQIVPISETTTVLVPYSSVSSTTTVAPPSNTVAAVEGPDKSVAAISAASKLHQALVNIICYAPAGSGVSSMTGSGVIVSPRGAILTNAHIAQYWLLADRGVICDIRMGSPAVSTYKAALSYISSKWVEQNASAIISPHPMGTGERDFALLSITETSNATQITGSLPYVPLTYVSPRIGQSVAIGSYGAQFLTADQIKEGLFPTVVLSSVKSIFTFSSDTPDVLSFVGTPAAQEGSSGGGVVNEKGELVGTITTSDIEGAVADRSLSALTAVYIRSEYAAETGQTLDTLLKVSNTMAIAAFAPDLEKLRTILEKTISNK